MAQDPSKFRAGDTVVLRLGTYQGTQGIFLHFNQDSHWADIAQKDGVVRSHPVEWLAHSEK